MTNLFNPINFPASDTYPDYAKKYIELVPRNANVLQTLYENYSATKELVSNLSTQQILTPYQEGKWSVAEILMHIIDTERIFAYRALRFARGDYQILTGFNQDDYVKESGANELATKELLYEFETTRFSTLAMFNNFSLEALSRKGEANGFSLSVGAAAYIIAGHEIHHLNIIKNKYL
jgi:DinB superfamily